MIIPESVDKMKIEVKRLIDYYKKMESEESSNETLGMNLLQTGHGLELRGKSD